MKAQETKTTTHEILEALLRMEKLLEKLTTSK